MNEDTCVALGDGCYALFFPHQRVTTKTVHLALPREIMLMRKPIQYTVERPGDAGNKRMNAKELERTAPVEVARARQMGLDLSQYILIRLQ